MPRLDITRWSPDSCSCHIYIDGGGRHISFGELVRLQEERWRANDPTALRMPPPAVELCPAHAHLGDTPQLLEALLEESNRKEKARLIVLQQASGMTLDDIGWLYDKDRVLVLNLPSGKCSTAQANALLGQIAALGAGKVKINRV